MPATNQRLKVSFINAARAPVSAAQVRQILQKAATDQEVVQRWSAGAGIAVRVTDDGELRYLNRSFAGEDHPTDVLSFATGEREHIGDLAVSWPAVLRQAEQVGHSPEDELALLLVHGLLHLLGWDHADPEQELAMTALTVRCLAAGGVAMDPDKLQRA